MYGWCFAKLCCPDELQPWCGVQANKLYLSSGHYVTTLSDSQAVSAPLAISWDGTNTPFSITDELRLQSGQFSATLKQTLDISVSIDTNNSAVTGISWDGTDTPWCNISGFAPDPILWKQSGQFSATVKTSRNLGSFASGISGISWDGTDTPWCGQNNGGNDKLFKQSGQFSVTLKTSTNIGSIDAEPEGISWDGTNTPWCGGDADGVGGDKLYEQSGQFSATIKDSVSVTVVDDDVRGVNTNRLTTG